MATRDNRIVAPVRYAGLQLRALEAGGPVAFSGDSDQLPTLEPGLVDGRRHPLEVIANAEVLPFRKRRGLLRARLRHHELAAYPADRTANQEHSRHANSLRHGAALAGLAPEQKRFHLTASTATFIAPLVSFELKALLLVGGTRALECDRDHAESDQDSLLVPFGCQEPQTNDDPAQQLPAPLAESSGQHWVSLHRGCL